MQRLSARSTESPVGPARAASDGDRQWRATLLQAGRCLGLEERLVVHFSETVTGRPWRRCGAAEVAHIGEALLDIALAVRAGHPTPSATTPGPVGAPRSMRPPCARSVGPGQCGRAKRASVLFGAAAPPEG